MSHAIKKRLHLRPPPCTLRRAAAKAEALRNVRIVTHANGMTTADLGDAFMFNVVVERRPDGTFGYRCVPKTQSTANLPKETK